MAMNKREQTIHEGDVQRIPAAKRTWMKRVFFASFLLALCISLLLAYYKAESLALAHPDPNAILTGWLAKNDIQTLLFVSTTVLVFVVFAFGNRAFLVGLQGVVIAAAGIGVVLCIIIHAIVHEINRIANWLCYFFSRGKISVYMEEPKPANQLSPPQALPGSSTDMSISEQEIPPHQIPETIEKELAIMASVKTTSFIFDRALGSELNPYIKAAVEKQEAAQYILSSGSDEPVIPLRRVLPDTEDISPEVGDTRSPVNLAYRAPEDVQKALFQRMGQKLARVHASRNGLYMPIFPIIGCERLVYSEEMFAEISVLPERCVVVLTTLTSEDTRKPVVKEGFKLLNDLWQTGKITGTLVVDPARSGFVTSKGRRALYSFFASVPVDSIVAPFRFENNLNSKQVFERLFASSGFATMSAASASVDAGKLPFRHRLWNGLPGGKIATGVGNISSVKSTLTSLITGMLTKPNETSALTAHAAPGSMSVYICEVPTSDPDHLSEIEEVVSWFVTQRDPQAVTIFVSANGTRTISEWRDPYFVQVVRLWSLPDRWFVRGEVIEGSLQAKEVPPANDQVAKKVAPHPMGRLDPLPVEETEVSMGNENGAAPEKRKRGRPRKQ